MNVGSRKRLRLISLVEPSVSLSTNVQICRPASARRAHAAARPARAASDLIRSRSSRRPRVLKLRQYGVGTVHVQTEQVLDPVIRVRTAARPRPHLSDPRPYGSRGRAYLDRACRNAIGVLEQLVPRQPRSRLRLARAPSQDGPTQQNVMEPTRDRRQSNGEPMRFHNSSFVALRSAGHPADPASAARENHASGEATATPA